MAEMINGGRAKTNPNVELWESPRAYTVDPETVPWTTVGEGAHVKVLRINPVANSFTVLFKLDAGHQYPVHKHLASAEFFVLQGTFGYEIAPVHAGGYGYEDPYAVHEPVSSGDEDMIMLAISNGPIEFYSEDGKTGILGGSVDELVEACLANNALGHLLPYSVFPPTIPSSHAEVEHPATANA